MITNRERFIEEYKVILKEEYPNLSENLVNDCVHGCLIAVNSPLGLSPEAHKAATRCGLTPTAEEIIKYVFTRPEEETDETVS